MDPVAACQEFIETHDALQLAAQLRDDSNLCKNGGRPSLLALLLPDASTDLADGISRHLLQREKGKSPIELPTSVRQLWYNGLVDGIRSHLNSMTIATYVSLPSEIGSIPAIPIPVKKLGPGQVLYQRQRRNVLCYICRLVNETPHKLYHSLCEACGSFNLANSIVSSPTNLDLRGKTALVTGGRVNLGFFTALRLLRCGARVIISSRYPRDAELRYHAESDSASWRARLKIVGADFRAAKDAFDLVAVVRQQIRSWSKLGRLDILINNAAQTLTDPVGAEIRAIEQEELSAATPSVHRCLLNGYYEPRVRGGSNVGWESSLQWHNSVISQPMLPDHEVVSIGTSSSQTLENAVADGWLSASNDKNMQLKSSWVQSLDEIPYEDLMTAHSVNFFVPLILCRELLPLMGKQRHDNLQQSSNDQTKHPASQESPESEGKNRQLDPSRPYGYIINVSSREGLFEDKMGTEAKNGKHVHTNTSKAALNMITQTEAANCWKRRKIAMNTVDPGYMSAAPEMHKYGDCPITFEDGAARVLWPIAIAEKGENVSYGKFFKHFGVVEGNLGH